jgi:LCP family protein required for cell wall assembly
VLTIVLIFFGFVLSGAAGAVAYFWPALVAGFQQTGQVSDIKAAASAAALSPTAVPPPGAAFTVLLLGSDDDLKFDPNQVLTQSMILVRVDPAAKKVTMLSIPRDLWVPLSTGRTEKIDAAYSHGKAAAALATVEQNFHVHIDDYAWIGLKGLIKLIDQVGGVDLVVSNPVLDDYYPSDINTTSPYGYTRVAVLPGAQRLNGTHALEYVRSRHNDLQSDFGRSYRQQQVLLALRAKANSMNAADLPDVVSALSGEFKTSMGLDRLRVLLGLAHQVDFSNIRQIILTPPYTSGGQIPGQSALNPHWDLILPLVRQYFP